MKTLSTVIKTLVMSLLFLSVAQAERPITVGPNGESPTSASSLTISNAQVATVKSGIAMANALGKQGKVGYIFHDADFYVTNQRDGAFKYTIENDYPDMSIVAEAGIADPANGEDIAHAMLTKNPDIDGIYVTWAEPALGVLSVLREQGNNHTKIVTLDLSEPVALDMVKGGNVAAIVADEAYNIGVTVARAAALGLLKQPVEPFLVVDALAVTADGVLDGWMTSLNMEAPATIVQAAQ